MTARAASAHAMLQKMVGSRHYAVRVPIVIPSDFGIGTVSCVHVYACFVALRARSFVVYRPVRFSCSEIMHDSALCMRHVGRAVAHVTFFPQSGTKCVPRKVCAGRGTFPPKAGLSRPKRDGWTLCSIYVIYTPWPRS